MAFGAVGALGTVNNKVASTTVAITTTADAEAGNVIVVTTSWDNDSGTGDSNDLSCADSAGNTYVKLFERSQGVTNGGCTVAVFYAPVTTLLSSGGTITITHVGSKTAKAATAFEFTKGAGTTLATEQATGNGANAADPGDITLAGMASREYLLLWGCGVEAPSVAFTQDADYTTTGTDSTTGGGTASNQSIGGGYRIATLTGDTVNAGTAPTGDHAQVLGAVYEIAAGATEVPFPYVAGGYFPTEG